MADNALLVSLPVEIQLSIYAHLIEIGPKWDLDIRRKPVPKTWESTLEHFPALSNLTLACKRLQKVVAPLLYRSVRVWIDEPSVFVGLIRHFSRVPDEAGLVRDINILGHPGRGSLRAEELRLSSNQAAFLSCEASRLGIQVSGPDCTETVSTASLLIDVLLCQVSNIRKLTIREPNIGPSPEVPMGLDYATRLPGNLVFESLQHVETLPPIPHPMSGMHASSLAALLRRTPALTHLRVGRCSRDTSSIIPCPLPQLENLLVVDASAEVLDGVARFCPQLKRVQFVEDTFEVTPEAFRAGDYPDYGKGKPIADALKSLLPLSSTLRDLAIHWESHVPVTYESLDLLFRFDALQSLDLVIGIWPPGDSGMFISRLPRGIRSLRVLSHDGMPVEDMAQLLSERVRDGDMPGFKTFRYSMVLPWSRDPKDSEEAREERIASCFSGTGVEHGRGWPWNR
jgi:hypothetical protein